MLMTRAQYAAHRGCETRAVAYAIEVGRIHVDANNMIESERADHDWDVNTDALRARNLPRNGQAAAGANGARNTKTMAFLEARTEREYQLVELKKLELAIKRGQLIERAEMDRAIKNVYGQVRALRDACLEIPDRLAPALAAETDPRNAREMLWAEITRLFARFAERPDREAAA